MKLRSIVRQLAKRAKVGWDFVKAVCLSPTDNTGAKFRQSVPVWISLRDRAELTPVLNEFFEAFTFRLLFELLLDSLLLSLLLLVCSEVQR